MWCYNHHELLSIAVLIVKNQIQALNSTDKLLQNKVIHHKYSPGLMLFVYFHQRLNINMNKPLT